MTKTLTSVLTPLTPSEFYSQYYSKKACHIKGMAGKLDGLFGFTSLNRILNTSPIPHPTMKMVLDGDLLYVTDSISIVDKCRDGATLIIDQVDKYDEKVGKFATAVAAETGQPNQVTMYYSQQDNQGFSLHYDTHDVFILQLSGFKNWIVLHPTIEFPLFHQKVHGSNPPQEPYLECTLGPNDVLYIPRGHWHKAVATKEASLHLTLGILERTGIEFLGWLVDELREEVKWREAFPVTNFSESLVPGDLSLASYQHFENLKNLLIEKLNRPELLKQYSEFCIARQKNPMPFNFPHQVLKNPTEDNAYRKFRRPSYQQAIIKKDIDQGFVEVIVWGKVFRFNLPAESLLSYIFSVTEFTDEELKASLPKLSSDSIKTLLNSLICEGIVMPE
ncbi:MAG: hypothetical protein F6K10_35120 [Moorea sp. SIO2B7]|nr:hypothetical protein [Moorena sp. SIO2B7]